MINKLVAEIKKKNAPIVVGLDPTLDFIPKYLIDEAIKEKGETLDAIADAIFSFNKQIVDATYELIPAVKPQVAMYESFGIPGLIAYKKTIDYCHEKNLVVIGDVKRGDIGSTSKAYALGHLGSIKVGNKEIHPFDEDFATINPYLGEDGINPFVDVAKENGKGLFILAKTSNPSSGQLQDKVTKEDDKPIYELVAKMIDELGASHMGEEYSYIGAVVGATYPKMGQALRSVMPKAYILVPGYGAQGATAKDLSVFFNADGLGAIINSSRGIIAAYKASKYVEMGYSDQNFADASRAAVIDMIEDIRTGVNL